MTELVTHDVKRFVVEKPKNYKFRPGQATDVLIDRDGFRDKPRPFTFTSLEDDLVLEFTIKGYMRGGVTEELHRLGAGDRLIIGDAWGAIEYKGPGTFIAAGAGITPFIAILRMLNKEGMLKGNRLLFSNKLHEDIILEHEFTSMLGKDFVPTLTRERMPGYEHGRIDKGFLERNHTDFGRAFYICGPEGFVEDMKSILKRSGVELQNLVFEG